MRKRCRVIFAVIGYIVFSLYMEAWGADWTLYRQARGGDFYYDVESINRPSKDIVRVWTKMECNELGASLQGSIVRLERGYTGELKLEVKHILTLIEFNCVEKQYRVLRKTYYQGEGTSIYSKSDIGKWDYIFPESEEEDLPKIVCK